MQDIAQEKPGRDSEDPGEKPRRIRRTIGLVAVGGIILAVLGAAIYALVAFEQSQGVTAVLRDISIVVLALVTIVIGLLLAILIYQLQSLIALLRNEIKPILDSANQTARTVRGTTTFVSDAVVSPVVSAASFATAVRETIKVLIGGNRKRNRVADPEGEPDRLP